MSDWDVTLISAGSLPMEDGLMAPAGELGDIEVVSNVVLLRGAAGTVLVDTAAGGLDGSWEGAHSDLAGALETYRRLLPVVDAVMNRAPGAGMAKAAMQLLGVLPNRNMRLPLVPASDELVENLRAALTTAGLLEENPMTEGAR